MEQCVFNALVFLYLHKLANLRSCRFRWAYCQLDSLRRCRTTFQARTAMSSLPTSLDETNGRILAGISDNDRPYALSVLRWLAFSARPVTLGEVSEARALIWTANAGMSIQTVPCMTPATSLTSTLALSS